MEVLVFILMVNLIFGMKRIKKKTSVRVYLIILVQHIVL